VGQLRTERLPKRVQWSLELMAMLYVAVTVLFLIDADWPILMVNKAFIHYDWPMVFFPTEKFWFSIALSVPSTRAFLAFTAARKPDEALFCVKILQISLLITAGAFAWQFLFHKHAPLYVLGCLVEGLQLAFYSFLHRLIVLHGSKQNA